MSTERRKVRLTPPPRVERARRSAGPEPTRPEGVGRIVRALTVLGFAALIAAAAVVFTILPRWAETKRNATASGADLEAPIRPEEKPDIEERVLEEPAAREPAAREPALPAPPPAAEPLPEAVEPKPAVVAKPAVEPPETAAKPEASEFAEAMTLGLAALDREDFAAARDAFERARALDPGSRPPVDGLTRAEAGLARLRIGEHRRRARDLEAEEEWRAALAQYEAALGIDPTLRFAQEGRSRSLERAELAAALDFHVENAERLATPAVLEEASIVLARAEETEPAGPRHERQVAELARIVEAYSTPVRVELRSDDATEVLLYKVGRLGVFSERVLELRPGSYTVVGSRQGYRDVRHRLVVEPGRTPEPLVVRCEEEI